MTDEAVETLQNSEEVVQESSPESLNNREGMDRVNMQDQEDSLADPEPSAPERGVKTAVQHNPYEKTSHVDDFVGAGIPKEKQAEIHQKDPYATRRLQQDGTLVKVNPNQEVVQPTPQRSLGARLTAALASLLPHK